MNEIDALPLELFNLPILYHIFAKKQYITHFISRCGQNISGTTEEKEMLLPILIRRVEVRQGNELNIQLAPGFEQPLNGLIEMRCFFAPK
ncbi:MAG: hypothetical protein ACI4O3_00175 [Oscillospiraceae bacterium]